MPSLEMIQKPRSKSINGLEDGSPSKVNPNIPIVREVEYPRFGRSDPIPEPCQAEPEALPDTKQNLDKGFIRGNKMLVAYGWWILGVFIAMAFGILLWMGVFGRLTSNFIPDLYRSSHAAIEARLPAALFFSALTQFLLIACFIPGVTFFQILISHLIGSFQIAFWLQFISVNLSILGTHFLIRKTQIKGACKKRFQRDFFFPSLAKKSESSPTVVSVFCWAMFIPYNYKTYVLSTIDKISSPVFYWTSIPFVAAHSATYAYLGTSIPYLLHKSKSFDMVIYSHFTTQQATLVVFL